MRKIFMILLCCLLLTSCGNYASNLNERLITIESTNTVDLNEALSPAIVGVGASSTAGTALGAGVCVAEGGYILTNSHVINGSNNITLYLSDGNTTSAKIIYEDTVLDFAIIKSSTPLPYLELSLDELDVGQNVIAVGTPISLMLKHTFTKGIVSALNRTIAINSASGEAYMQNLIQHDASLNPGNSGGPLLNENGQVVGINTLKISSGEGIGFAIPVKSFVSILDKVTKGNIALAPYLGVYGFDAEIAKFNNLTTISSGFYIEDISSQSPADIFLDAGDIIIAINGVNIANASDLRHELFKYNHGENISIKYIKNNKTHTSQITLSQKDI